MSSSTGTKDIKSHTTNNIKYDTKHDTQLMRIEQLKEQRKSVSTELLKLMELKQMELRMQISRIDLDMAKSGYESETDVTQVRVQNPGSKTPMEKSESNGQDKEINAG